MKTKIAYISLSILALVAFTAQAASAQNDQNTNQPAAAAVSDEVNKAMASEELSIYGEIQSVDAQGSGALTVQYYDYDADDEKTVTIALDANTKLDNANSINDIKKGDWADVTYSTADGKNKASSVIVEKEEDTAVPAAPEQTVVQEQVPVKEVAQASGNSSY